MFHHFTGHQPYSSADLIVIFFHVQGYGRSLWLMQGMFRANGGCGYIKKPDLLLKSGSDSDIFDPKATLPVKTTLRVRYLILWLVFLLPIQIRSNSVNLFFPLGNCIHGRRLVL